MTLRHRTQVVLQWIGLGALVGLLSGLASALFLHLLDQATRFRLAHEAVVYALPFAGLAIGWVYERFGGSIKGGNNLVLDTIHEDRGELPLRMAPMVLIGTVLTHLFGGSAGREGTAVQMGASLSDLVAHRFKLSREVRRQLLAAGIAGGFGSVFGTPIAGMLFGLEVVWVGRVEYHALLPALVASIVGDFVTRACGVHHSSYPTLAHEDITPALALKWLVFGAVVALVASAFIETTHRLKYAFEKQIPRLPLRMLMGGALVVTMWRLVGTSDYLGLGVPQILSAFSPLTPPAPLAFAAKLLFTAVTLASGFIGGEVTPLFFVGATLGGAVGPWLGIPAPLAAGVGLAGVFAAAANTPISLSIMAVELLGAEVLPHVMIVCVVAYLFTGQRGIYPAQRLSRWKTGARDLTRTVPLRDAHSASEAPPSEPPPPVL